MANQVDFKILPSDQFNVYSPQNRSEKVITYFTLLSKLRGDILSVSAEDDPNDIVSAYYSNTGGTQTLHLVKADGSEVTASQPQQIISGTVNYISKFTTSNDIGNSQVFDDGTNVGIGTTTMTHKLQLGTGGVFADYYQLDTTYSNGFVVGALSWDIDNGTMDVGLSSNLKLKVGQDDVWYVKNQTGSSIAKGTAVYASGTLGASSKILISPMIANGTIPAKFFLGIVAETIANGAEGYVLTKGKLRNINTSAYNEGDVLWVSPTTAGALTATEPTAPNLKLPVAFVVNKGNNGVLAIRATTGQRIADASDVDYAGASDNSFLVYNSSTGVWEDESVGIFKTIAVSGQSDVVADTYTDTLTLVAGTNVTITTNASTDSITINSTDQYVGTVTSVATTAPITGGTITTTGTIGITQSGASSDGYLSSTDWNTFNNKQGSLTFTAPLVNTSGTVTITQASASANGYLSSTDWNTFNNKASDAFKTIAVSGQSNIVADSATDTLTFEAGTNIVITTDAATDKITISAVGGGTGSVTSVDMSVPTGFAISGNPITTSGTLALAFASGYSLPTNASQGNWDTAYNNSITAFAYNTSTGVLTLTQQDAGTLTATVTLQPFSTTNLTEGTNLYFTTARARQSLSAGTGISYDNSTGVITNSAPDQIVSLTGGTGISTSGTYPSFTITNTLPDQTVVLNAGTGITTSGTYPNFTITNSDRGSSQNIFKNIAVAGQSTIVADSNDDTLTVASGTGISLATNATSDTLTITNTAPDQTVVLNAGTGISTSGTYPNFTITNTLPDQTVVLTGAGTTVVTGTYPSFTITSNDQYVGTVTSVATTAPITGGTITTSGTIGITQSTTSSDGYLSSTDWNTFNAKIGGSGTTNYVAKFTGGSAIGNSSIYDNGSVGIGTTNPIGKLTVKETDTSWELNTDADAVYQLAYNRTTSAYKIMWLRASSFVFAPNDLEKVRITSDGNVGIGTTNPVAKLQVVGTVATDSALADVDAYRIIKPNGGVRTTGNSTENGAIKITYPVGFTYTMHRVKVNVYEYTTNESFTIYFGGYTYAADLNWYNEFAYILDNPQIDRNFTVRFGYDGTKAVVYIGELSSSWTYPQIFIEEVELGYSGQNSTWRDGAWSIGFEASAFQNVTRTVSNPQATNWARNGSSAYYGFGNVGVGTSSPANKFVATSDASPTSENTYAIAAASSTDPAYKTIIGYDYSGDIGLIAAVRTGIGWRNITMPQGSFGIGTAPSEKLHVSGNIRVTGAYYDSNNSAGTSDQILTSTATGTDWKSKSELSLVDGSGTANYVSKWSDTDTLTNSIIYDNGTNVGVGTSNPSGRFDISASAGSYMFNLTNADETAFKLRAYNHGTASAPGLAFTYGLYYSTQENTAIKFYRGGGSTGGFMTFTSSDGAEKMRLSSDGYFGINTTSPSVKLHVQADALGSTAGNQTYAALFQANNANGSFLEIKDVRTSTGTDWTSAGKRIQMRIDSTYMGYVQFNGDSNNGGISFGTGTTTSDPGNVTEKMRINASGNVGIGTTAPSTRFQVNKGSSGNVASFTTETNTAGAYAGITLNSTTQGADDWYGSEIRSINVQGNPNFLNPRLAFFVQNTNTYLPADRGEKMTINGDGNVGIGTTAPGYKLQVIGGQFGTYLKGGDLGSGSDILRLVNASDVTTTLFRGDGNVSIGSAVPLLVTAGRGNLTINGSTDAVLTLGISDSWKSYYYTNSSGTFIASEGNRSLALETNGATRLRITGDGNVGIGTTAPTSILQVVGDSVQSQGTINVNNTKSAGGAALPAAKFRNANGNHSYGIVSEFVIGNGAGTDRPSVLFYSELEAKSWQVGITTTSSGWGTNGDFAIGYRASNTPSAFNTWPTAYFTITSAGNVGIGTTGPSSKLDVQLSSYDGITLSRAVQSGGSYIQGRSYDTSNVFRTSGRIVFGATAAASAADGFITFNTYSANTENERMRITSVGNVGIGTTSPAQRLDIISGNVRLRTNATGLGPSIILNNGTEVAGNYSQIAFGGTQFDSTYLKGAIAYVTRSETNGRGDFYFLQNTANTQANASLSDAVMVVSNLGNVGIGTTGPAQKLHVAGKGLISNAGITGTPSWSNNSFEIQSSSGETVSLEFHRAGFTSSQIWSTGNNLIFGTASGTERMRVQDDNVGIGTSSPQARLHVSGTVSYGSARFSPSSATGESAIAFYDDVAGTATSTSWVVGQAGWGHTGDFVIGNENGGAGGNVRLLIERSGNVGIGTTAPSGKLHITGVTAYNTGVLVDGSSTNGVGLALRNASGHDWYIISTGSSNGGGANNLGFYNNNVGEYRVYIKSDGNVGIGTTTPGYKLDVSGTIRATGDVIAYSDARVKENVETLDGALDKVMKMRGVSYNKIGEQEKKVGVIAQEILEVLPEVVSQDETGTYSVAYGNISAVLIEAIKELTNTVKEQQKQIDELKSKLK